MDNYLMHYGIKRRSGRYPWGSGENPYQHDGGFYSQVRELREQGLNDKQIAEQLEMTTTQLRARYSLAKDAFKAEQISKALYLHDKGYSNTKIGEMMSLPESTIRNYINPTLNERVNKTAEIADVLAKEIDKKKYLDIGAGVEYQLGVSRTKLNTAVAMLEDAGYKKWYVQVEQATNPGRYTSTMVLAKYDPKKTDSEQYKELYSNRDKIKSVLDVYSEDGGRSLRGIEKPVSIDSKRIKVNYKEDGGDKKDGLIEIRPGVSDLYMGNNKYSQVRIAVDDTHYLKGMAVFNDDMPKGVDIIFNTNKEKGTPVLGDDKNNTVLKILKADKDNPFESTVRQIHYIDKDGNEKMSAINIVNDDDDWAKWSKTLSSQFLSKQRLPLIKQQLDLSYKNKEAEFKDDVAITNPALKQRLLYSFADDCDSAAVHLKAAALPRQGSHVILPINSLKENEIYAPNYNNGEEVILIRHPHAGTFEIPRLKVNNNNKEGKKIIGPTSATAVGINYIVAQQLSGADFDGDTVLVIPTRNQNIRTSRPFKELIDFNPSERYKSYDGMPEVSDKTGFHKQAEMGKVSNLITDMTIKGATPNEIIRAVKHSMVVIDAEKHNLNWRQSETDNGIKELKAKYQGGANRGASTIISRAKSKEVVPHRENRAHLTGAYDIDPATGEKIWTYTGKTKINKAGKEVPRTLNSTKMYERKDAYELVSDARMPVEITYASYANKMKALANEARKEAVAVKPTPYSPSARKIYEEEVGSLNAKLNLAKKHAPQERRAQLVTDVIVKAKVADNPELREDYDALKKVKAQVLEEQRTRTGGKKSRIEITEKEWQAIQAGAISNSKLKDILDNTDLKQVKKLATPRTSKGLTTAQLARAKSLASSGYTLAEIASMFGVSSSTIQKAIKKGEE